MSGSDQQKVIEAGFMIIRTQRGDGLSVDKRITGGKIKYKDKDHKEWTTLEKDFSSDNALQKRVKELLKSPTVIMD